MKFELNTTVIEKYKLFSVLLLVSAITINTPLIYIAATFILLLWIFEADRTHKLELMIHDRIAQSFLALFFLHLAGLLWTESWPEGLRIFSKQKVYLFAPMLIVFINKETARLAVNSLIGVILVTQVYSVYLYYLPPPGLQPSDLSPFMNHMHFSLILVFTFAYLIYSVDISRGADRKNTFLLFASALSLFTLFINIGRIGQVALPVVLMVLAIRKFKLSLLKSSLIVASLVTALFSAAYAFNPQFERRVDRIVYEFQVTVGQDLRASIACRFEMWGYAMELGNQNPLLGIGTGDSIQEMSDLLGHTELEKLYKECNLGHRYQLNPHNNFFLFYMQFGLLGIVVLVAILLIQLRTAVKIDSTPMILILTTTIVGMLTTSLISVHVKYMFFYAIVTTLLYIRDRKEDKSIN